MKKIKTILFVLLLGCLVFIWGNSLMNQIQSQNFSDKITVQVYETVQQIAEKNVPYQTVSFFVRKLAHFSQFFVLGFVGFHLCLWPKRNYKRWIFFVILGVAVAGTDEIIQIFSPGRGPSVRDVFIDVSGYLAAGFVCLLLHRIIRFMLSKRKVKNEC